MTYEKFLTEVLSSIQTMLPAETEVSLRTIQKNNNCILDGLVFSTKDIQASPTIYLNAYYKNDFRNGVPIEAICRQVLAQYEKARLPEPIDTTFYSDFEKLKDQIIFRIVNRELNADLLSEIPHMDYLDLSITFLALLSVQQTADATIQIRNSHLALWDVPTDTLFELAKKNTPRLLASDVRDLRDLLKEISPPGNDLVPEPEEVAYPMYVLTNQIRLHGAGCILYDNLLASLSQKFDDDFYIIPSSIHEVLLIPQAVADERAALDAMICEVNRTQVPADEILSDHAYLYSRKRNEIVY